MSAPTGWEGILDPGEEIIWQGRPDQSFQVGPGQIFMAIFGAGFAGFALFWMVMASTAGGIFWMFGLIHFSVGAFMTWSAIFGNTRRRRHTWYTLTDRRAFIATALPQKGRDLKSFPINDDTTVTFRAGPPDSIFFAKETKRGNKGRTYDVDVGFERLEDGHEVMRIIRKRIHNVSDLDEDEVEA